MLIYDLPKNPLKAVTDKPEYVFKVGCFRSQSDKELSALSSLVQPESQSGIVQQVVSLSSSCAYA